MVNAPPVRASEADRTLAASQSVCHDRRAIGSRIAMKSIKLGLGFDLLRISVVLP